MSSTDDPYGTATFTDTRANSPSDDSYTDSNSLEEVEASLNDLDDELEHTQNTVSNWSSSYPGSPSFISLPTLASPPPPPPIRLSRITERTEEDSRPSSLIARPAPDFRRSLHSRASTEPAAASVAAAAGLPPPGRATELIAVFEAAPVGGHVRGTSSPSGARSPSPFFTPASSDISSYAQGFHSTFGSRPASPTKSGRVTSPVSGSGSRTRPSMGTLLSQPPLSSSGYTGTRTDTFTNTNTNTDTFTPTPSNTNTNTYTPSNTTNTQTQTQAPTTPPSLRRPAQGSPRSPLASVRNIVALWKERTPTRKSPSASGSSSKSSSGKSEHKPAENPLPALPLPGSDPEDGLFAMRRRARPEDTASLRSRSASLRSARTPSLRRHESSGSLPPSLNVAELSAYAQSSEPPLHIGLLWFLNVHAPPPYRWQRTQALLYPHLLLLSWLAPGGGRGLVGLDLVHCTSVQSTPSPSHPGARDDVGSVAARVQSEIGEPGVNTLVDLLVPFQMVYEDGVERLAAESLYERQRWVNRIWEAVHRPPTAESSSGSSAGDADAEDSASDTRSRIARSESIRTILSVDSAGSAGSAGSVGSRSTVFVPPVGDIPDMGSASETSSSGVRSGAPSEAWRRAYTPTGTRTGTGTWTPTGTETRTGTYTPTGTRGTGTWTPSEYTYTRTFTPSEARTYVSDSQTRTGTAEYTTRTGSTDFATRSEYTRTQTPTDTATDTQTYTTTQTQTHTTTTGVRRRASLVPSHHSGTVDDSVIDRGAYVYPGDPRAIGRRGPGGGARRGSMGELDEGLQSRAPLGGSGNGSGSEDVFLSAESGSDTFLSAGSGSEGRSSTRTGTGTGSGSSTGTRRSGTLYSQSVGLRTGAFSSAAPSVTFGSPTRTFTGSPTRTFTGSPTRSTGTTGTLSYRGPGSASLLGDSHSDYTGSSASERSDTYTYSYGSPSRSGTGTSLARAREVRRRPGLGLGGGRTTSSGYTYSGSGSDSYSRSASESEDKENSSTDGDGPPSDSNGDPSGSGGTGSGFTPGTYSTNQTGYDICTSSDLSDVTTRTTSGYTPLSSSPPSSSPPSSGSSSPPPSSSGSSDRFITASQGSSSSSEYTTAQRAPSSASSYASFPTIPSESAYQTAPSDMGDIPSEMGTPRPAPSVLPSEDEDEKGSLMRVPSLVPTIRSESSVSDHYPPLPPSSVSSEQYPPLPPSTVSSEHYPPLPPSTVSSEQYPPLPPSTVSSEHYPPLPPSTVSSEQYPPLPPSTLSSSSVSDVSSLSFSTKSSSLPYLEPPTPYESSEESSDVATPMSLAFSSASSASVSGPSPIQSQAPPSTVYAAPSELTRSMTETSLTSSSNLTPLSRALSSLRSWGRASSGTYESSILGASPSVGSIALHDPPDTSGETSFLRPTASLSSFDRLSTIPRSEQSLLSPLPPPSSSLSDVSTPSSSEFPSESSSLGRTLSVMTQSSVVSDSSSMHSMSFDDDEGSLPESEPMEPATTSLLTTPRSTPRPSRPPSSVAPSTRSLRTPEPSGSVSVSTPRGDTPSMRSVLETVPSYRAPSTHGVTLEHLADELRRLADLRGEENQDIADNVRALRNELRDLADFLQHPVSRAPSVVPQAPSPVPHAPSPVPAAPPSPARATRAPGLLEPPMSYTAGLSRSSSNASSISFLSSHYSDDDLPSPLPDSPYPGPRDLPESTPDYSPATSYPYSTSTPLPPSSSESSGRPYPPSSPSPSSSSSPISSSSSSTVRPANYLPILESIRGTVNDLANSTGNYGPILESIRGLVAGLWQGQASTNHLLDQLREREREPHVAPDTELNDRMNRIEDLLQSIVNQPREAPQPQPPIVIHTPGPEREPSDSASESSIWSSILPRMPPMRDVPDVRMPVPAVPPGRSFAQQLDDLLSSAGTGVPLEPAEQPPQVVPFTYDVQERGLRPRSGVGVTVPAGQPPPRARTVPLTTQGARRRPVLPQDFRDAPRDRFRAPPRAGPSEPETFFTQPARTPTQTPAARPTPQRPPAEPVMPTAEDLHPPRRTATAPDLGREGERRREPWYRPRRDDRLPPSPGPSVTMQGVPPVVQLPPVFDSLMEILRENRLAQLATVDQQRELMRYMRGLNEWLERDVHDRQAELRGVVARVDQLRDDMRARAIPAQGAPGPPGGDDSGSSDGSDGPPVILPDQGPPVVPRPPPEPWQRPGFQPLHYQPFPVIPREEDGRPFIPPRTDVPFIPDNLPPPMPPFLFQPGPAPPVPMPGPNFMPMPQPQPFFDQPTRPFFPPDDRSPLEVDPAVIPMPVSSRSSSSSEGRRRRPRRRRDESESRSRSSGSGERPIIIQQPSHLPPPPSDYQQSQAPPPQPIIINPPQQQYIPQPSVPIVLPDSRRSRSRSRSRSRRSSSRSRSPPIIVQGSRRSRSSRSGRRSRRSRSPEPITVVQAPGPGMIPTMMPTQGPVYVHSRGSRSRSRSRSRHHTPPPIVIPSQTPYPPPQTQAPVIIDSGRRSPPPIIMSRRSRSRSRSHSPRYYERQPSYSRRSRSRSRHSPPIIIGGTTAPPIITHSRRSRSRSRSRSPPIIVTGSRRSRSRRSRSPRHYPDYVPSHGAPIILPTGSRRSRSRRSRSRSRSRSPRPYYPSSHHTTAPPVIIPVPGTHRSRRSHSPTYIATHSRSRSPRRDPGTSRTHRPHTHYSDDSRSRSPGGGRRRTRRPRSPYSDREVSPGGHRRPRRRSASYSDGSRSPGGRRRTRRARSPYSDREVSPGGHRRPRRRSASLSDGSRSPGGRRRPRRRGTELRESDPRRTEVPEIHTVTVPSHRDYSEHAPTRGRRDGSYSPRPSFVADAPDTPLPIPVPASRRSGGPATVYEGDRPGASGSMYEGDRPGRSGAPGTVYEGDRPGRRMGPGTAYEGDRPEAPGTVYEQDRPSRIPTAVRIPEDEGPKYFDRNGRPITPVYDSAGRAIYPVGRSAYDAERRPITPPGGHPIQSEYEPDEGVPGAPSRGQVGQVPRPGPSGVHVPPSIRPDYDDHNIPVPAPGRSVYGDQPVPQPVYGEHGVPQSAYSEQRPGATLAEEPIRPLPGRPISPGRYSPRPAVTPFPVDLAQADAERERLERLAEVENRLQGVAQDAAEAEDQREREFRKNEEDRERIFMESEQRREQEARERQDAIWRDMEGLGAPPRPPTMHTDVGDGASIHSVQAATDAASLLASSIKDTVQAEREEFAREREEMAVARARLEAERDAARDALLGEKEARVKALEEELATLRGEIDNERQLRSTENAEAQERERQVLADTSETRAQLGDITNLIQDQQAACERKKELMEERWNQKQERRQDKEFKWIELRDMVQKIHDDMEADRVKADEKRLADESKPGIEKVIEELTRQNAEQRELLNSLSDSWRADCTRQHEETIAAVRSTAQEQVHFNVQGYLDDFSKALASEVRMLLGEVGKLREERRALQHELGYLLCMKAKYGPGGEFEPDWKPPPGAPGGPPLDPPAPAPPPDLPQAKPGWRTVPPQRPATARKQKKKDAGPPPAAAPAPDPRRQVQSWATWQPDPAMVPTPPSHEPTLLVPDSASPGLFGPRSPRESRYGN